MYSKKEITVIILGIIFFALLIVELPYLERKLSNRKEFNYDEKTEQTKQIDKYVCTFQSKSNTLSQMIEATFYIDNDKVKRIYTKTSKSYTKKSDFESAVAGLKQDVKTENLETKTTLDNLNYTIIEVRGEDIVDKVKTTYPTDYKELTEYLDKNNYACTIRYKK